MRAHSGCVTGVWRGSPNSGTSAALATTATSMSVFSLPRIKTLPPVSKQDEGHGTGGILDHSPIEGTGRFSDARTLGSWTGRPGCGQYVTE
jgi:hypothetical protein